MIIICDTCRKEYEAAAAGEIMAVATRPGVMDNGIRCPHCDAFTHSYYTDIAMRRKQAEMKDALALYTKRRNEVAWTNYKTLQAEYQVMHDVLNPVEDEDGAGEN